jgi:ribosomal protein S27AE
MNEHNTNDIDDSRPPVALECDRCGNSTAFVQPDDLNTEDKQWREQALCPRCGSLNHTITNRTSPREVDIVVSGEPVSKYDNRDVCREVPDRYLEQIGDEPWLYPKENSRFNGVDFTGHPRYCDHERGLHEISRESITRGVSNEDIASGPQQANVTVRSFLQCPDCGLVESVTGPDQPTITHPALYPDDYPYPETKLDLLDVNSFE